MALLSRLELVGNNVAVALNRGVMSSDTASDTANAATATHTNSFHQRLKNRIVRL